MNEMGKIERKSRESAMQVKKSQKGGEQVRHKMNEGTDVGRQDMEMMKKEHES